MSRIHLPLRDLNSDRYLRLAALLLVLLTFASLLFCAMTYELGCKPVSFLGTGAEGPTDRLADLIKVTFSYRTWVAGIRPENLHAWPKIFETYYLSPNYAGKEGLTTGHLTHFHLPPLTTLMYFGSAKFIVLTQSARLDVLLFFALYLASVQWAVTVGIPRERRTSRILLVVWLFALVSYPALELVARGNFQAGITSMMIMGFLLRVFLRKEADIAALLSLAIAVNFRPNAAVFILAIPLALGFKRSIKPLIYFAVVASAILAFSYTAVHLLYPDYTIRAFLRGLEIYKKLYVTGDMGDGGNASLWALTKNYNSISLNGDPNLMFRISSVVLLVSVFVAWRRIMSWMTIAPVVLFALYAQLVALSMNDYSSQGFVVFSILVVGAAGWALRSTSRRTILGPFLLSAVYCLVCPVFAEYHLLIFLAPMIALYFCEEREWKENYRSMAVIAGASLLLLVPKGYLYFDGLSFVGLSAQTLINPLIAYCAAMYLATEAYSTRHATAPESAAGEPVFLIPAADEQVAP